MQAADDAYSYLDGSPSKAIEAIVAIAGWPTLYSVNLDTYTIPASGGDLTTGNGFSTIKRYANAPKVAACKLKEPYPEAGGFSIGSCEIELLDKYTTLATARELTDLASRAAYIEGNVSGTETTLNGAITKTATSLTLADATGFANGDVLHVGQEAILLANKSGNSFSGCTRAYLLTVANQHADGVKCYAYLPNLRRRLVYVYKGYQTLGLASFLKGWGGVIDGVDHSPGRLHLHAEALTWEMYGGRAQGAGKRLARSRASRTLVGDAGTKRKIVRLGVIDETNSDASIGLVNLDEVLDGDYRVTLVVPVSSPSGLGDGHYLLKYGDFWMGIVNPLVSDNPSGSGKSLIVADLVKGLGNQTYPDQLGAEEALELGWTNATFTAAAEPAGDLDPVTLLLQFLASADGDGVNGTYDDFKRGIGLAIPEELLDVTSFTDITGDEDYDPDLRVYFVFSEPEDAKDFFEEELCRPFGWYLAPRNDGRIRLVRPKNPTKLYFSKANNLFWVTVSSKVKKKLYTLPAGVYTGAELATNLQTGLTSATGVTWTVSFNSGTGIFTFSVASGTFTITVADAADTWATVGITSNKTAVASTVSDVAVALFTDTSESAGDYNVIDQDDMEILGQVDTLGIRIGEVWFSCNYDWTTESFGKIKIFSDSEVVNLDDRTDPYVIESRGLLAAFDKSGARIRTPFGLFLPPSQVDSCNSTFTDVSSSYGIDASNSFATLFCEHLFDRYRVNPVRFKARLKWKFNRLELGDNVRVDYNIDGVFADYEKNAGTLTTRIFEVVSIQPDFANGHVDVELLGHRSAT